MVQLGITVKPVNQYCLEILFHKKKYLRRKYLPRRKRSFLSRLSKGDCNIIKRYQIYLW